MANLANLAHTLQRDGHVANLLWSHLLADADRSIRVHANPFGPNEPVISGQKGELAFVRPGATVAEQVVRVVDGREEKQAIAENHQKRPDDTQAAPVQHLNHNSVAVRVILVTVMSSIAWHAHTDLT